MQATYSVTQVQLVLTLTDLYRMRYRDHAVWSDPAGQFCYLSRQPFGRYHFLLATRHDFPSLWSLGLSTYSPTQLANLGQRQFYLTLPRLPETGRPFSF